MAHYSGNRQTHSMLQGIGQKIKYAAQIAGHIKTGFNLARNAYSLFQAASPYLVSGLALL